MRRNISVIIISALVLGTASCEVYTDYIESSCGQKIDYQLRDRGPAGGWIFHVIDNPDGTKTYYEAAPVDQGVGVTWINSGTSPNPQQTLNGNTLTAIGTGWDNTLAIILQLNHTSSAAQLCRNYRGGGFSDWFLPSMDELERICWNLRGIAYNNVQNPDVAAGGVGGLGDHYWSSSEFNLNNARFQQFSDGYPTYDSKSGYRNVRAVRKFTY